MRKPTLTINESNVWIIETENYAYANPDYLGALKVYYLCLHEYSMALLKQAHEINEEIKRLDSWETMRVKDNLERRARNEIIPEHDIVPEWANFGKEKEIR